MVPILPAPFLGRQRRSPVPHGSDPRIHGGRRSGEDLQESPRPRRIRKPQTAEAYVNQWGADILRLWVASQDYRGDIVVSEDRIAKIAESYRLIRNTLRFQLANLFDFDPNKHLVPDDQLTPLDRWILSELHRLEQAVTKAYDQYEFHLVYQRMVQFVSVELSALYHDVIKDRLYTLAPNAHPRRSSQTALYRLVQALCQLLSPILVFTTDEAWEYIPGERESSVHEILWQSYGLEVPEEEQMRWKTLLAIREQVLPELEKLRKAKIIGRSAEAAVHIRLPGSWWQSIGGDGAQEILRELLNVSHLTLAQATDGAKEPEVQAEKAPGSKCVRCWRWDPSVGQNTEHPSLCARCIQTLDELRITPS